MSKAEIGAGDVTIDLDGHTITLKPTLKAAMALSRTHGGLTAMVGKCLAYDFDTIHKIIADGSGINSKDLPELIFRTGLIELAPPCIRFVHILCNGGRPLTEEEQKGGDGNDAPLNNSL